MRSKIHASRAFLNIAKLSFNQPKPRDPEWRVKTMSRADALITAPSRLRNSPRRSMEAEARRRSWRRCVRRFDAVTQNALELGGVVGVGKLAGAGQIQIVESRDPESQCCRTQQCRPLRAFDVGQRADRVVGTGQRVDLFRIERSLAVAEQAPVVHCDREIVSEEIGCRESEIDDAGDAAFVE